MWEIAGILMRGRLLIKSTKLSWWGIGRWGSTKITLWVWRIWWTKRSWSRRSLRLWGWWRGTKRIWWSKGRGLRNRRHGRLSLRKHSRIWSWGRGSSKSSLLSWRCIWMGMHKRRIFLHDRSLREGHRLGWQAHIRQSLLGIGGKIRILHTRRHL